MKLGRSDTGGMIALGSVGAGVGEVTLYTNTHG